MMKTYLLFLTILFMSNSESVACPFPSLQGAFRNDMTILIGDVVSIKKDKYNISHVKLSNVKSLNGDIIYIDSIAVSAYNVNLNNYSKIIFAPYGGCGSDQIIETYDWGEIWLVKKNYKISKGVFWDEGEIDLMDLPKYIPEWKKMGSCSKC